jgi:hypothetical protein
MVSLVDLARSLDSFGPQSAATPATISRPLPPGKASAEPIDAAPATSDVSISAEGVRQLQHAAKLDEEQAATVGAVHADAELAARMAHEMAYRREVIVAAPTAYSNLATSLYASGTSPASNAANVPKAQFELEQARTERIALYEFEKAKGTPPAKIYERLLALAAARPAGYRIATLPEP